MLAPIVCNGNLSLYFPPSFFAQRELFSFHVCSMSHTHFSIMQLYAETEKNKNKKGLVRESNPGPLAPEARIMPLDQQASDEGHPPSSEVKTERCTYV